MNNAGKAFSSALTSFSFYQGIGFLETLKNPANLFKNNLDNTRNNIKSEIPPPQKKMVELWNY